MGGRMAERMLLGDNFTQGAGSDMQQVRKWALQGVLAWGMGSRIGDQIIVIDESTSEATKEDIRLDVKDLVDEARATAWAVLDSHRAVLRRLVDELLKYNDLNTEQLAALMPMQSSPLIDVDLDRISPPVLAVGAPARRLVSVASASVVPTTARAPERPRRRRGALVRVPAAAAMTVLRRRRSRRVPA